MSEINRVRRTVHSPSSCINIAKDVGDRLGFDSRARMECSELCVFSRSFDARHSEICNFADDPDNRLNINGACNGMLVRLC
jgi:hypothetical protein